MADATAKLKVRDRDGRPVAFVLTSSELDPSQVESNVLRARRARAALGAELRQPILEPWHVGWAFGKSYAVWPYRRPLARGRVMGRAERIMIRPYLLGWLRATTRATWFRPAGSTGQKLRAGLLGLERLTLVSDQLRKVAGKSLERLDAGAWHPCRVLTHGDFWLGNVLEGRHGLTEPGYQPWDRFSIIDWAGSRTDGLPIYDLIRLTMSVRLSPRAFRTEVEAHCRALECPVSDAPLYLAASLGEIGQNLNHFPVQNFARMADSCLRELARIGL